MKDMATKKTAVKQKITNKFMQKTKSLADIITAVGIIGAAIMSIGSWIVTKITAETNEKLDTIIEKVDSVELNSTRSQLLTLIADYPDNESEILKVAQYYFRDLGGDWYMTGLFIEWADERGVDVSNIVKIHGE